MDLKKLAKQLTEYAKSSNYDNHRSIRAELTGFETGHRVDHGRNGVSELLNLQTQVIELNGILIENSSRCSLLSIYMHATVKSSQRCFEHNETTFIKIRKANGKYEHCELAGTHKEIIDRLQWLLERPDLADFDAQSFERFVYEKTNESQEAKKVTHLVKDEFKAPSLKELRRDFSTQILDAPKFLNES
jgi:hypothetical protein